MKGLCLILVPCLVAILAGCPSRTAAGQGDAGSAATPATVGAPGQAGASGQKSLQAASMERNSEMAPSPTGYGGSVPVQRSTLILELSRVYKGSPFASDYKEDRGHSWAMTDLRETGRRTAKTPGSCITCKTSDIEGIFKAEGWGYAKRPLDELLADEHPGVDCASCHDPKTHALRVVQPGFIEAAERGGIDLASASRATMMVNVCAQCHAEYYFEPGTNRVVHPWETGITPQAIYDYYEAKPSGFEADYTNPDSGVKLLKAQHPDFEEYSSGVHASAGRDMRGLPYARRDRGREAHDLALDHEPAEAHRGDVPAVPQGQDGAVGARPGQVHPGQRVRAGARGSPGHRARPRRHRRRGRRACR